MRIKILAALSALAMAVGMVAFASMPSSAHQGNIVASATCNPATGNYDVTYTLSWSNVPSGVEAALSTRTGTKNFASGWSYNTWSDWTSRGNSTGGQGSIQWTEQLPGNTAGNGPWVYAYTKWSNDYKGSLKHDTRIEKLNGDCKIPTPLDASAKAHSIPATCEAPGSVTFSTESATWENTTDITDGSRKAFANKGHLFPGGVSTIDVGYVLQPQKTGVECMVLVTPVKPTVVNSYEVCNSADGSTSIETGTISFAAGHWTWRDSTGNVVSGTQDFAQGSYTFTATAEPDYKFDDQGSTTASFTVTVGFDKDTGPCLIKVTPVTPKVTATDVCSNDSDAITVDSTQEHVKYTITWNADRSVATVTATITDPTKYYFEVGATTSWQFTFTNEPCVVLVSIAPSAAAQTCVAGQSGDDYTLKTGGVNVGLDTNLQYTITGTGSTGYPATIVTAAFTALNPGDYTVSVVALNDFVLESGAVSEWSVSVDPGLCAVSVGHPKATPETCSVFDEDTTVSGKIWVDFSGNLANEVEYRIQGTGVDYVATQEDNTVAPGDYTVTVTAKHGFTLDHQQNVWHLTIDAAPTCSLITHGLVSTTASATSTSCTSPGTYTLANTEGVLWYQDVNGVKTLTKAGTHKVNQTSIVKIHAQLVDFTYGWEDDAQTDWTFNFANASGCLTASGLAFTGSTGSNAGLLLAGGLLLIGGTVIAFERRFRTNAK